ncbi:MAG: glycosyltransferase [Candidatus Cloacimonadaceae bacterium]
MSASKRLLLFAYFYPPLGGPAVQRPCKTVKYLTALGWQVDVITIKDIVYHSRDESLLSECRHHKIFRTASLDPMFMLNNLQKLLRLNTDKLYFQTKSTQKKNLKKLYPIDDKIGWLPFAIQAGKKALLTNRYDAMMVTCGPFSSALAARHIAKLGKIPFIMDYRDHWTLNNTTQQHGGFFYKLLQRVEQSCLQSATLVLTATDSMKQALTKHFGQYLEAKTMTFYNGWDEADFVNMLRSRQPDGIFRIVYPGTLYGDRPLAFFLSALQQIHQENPEADFEFWLVGNFYAETHQEVENSGVADKVKFIGQQSHQKAIQMMLDADILLLVIGDAKHDWVVTGKLFEYLRSQRPILALATQQSEAAMILREAGHESICDIDDTAAIKAALQKLFSSLPVSVDQFIIPSGYERFCQVRNLAERLQEL